MKMFLLECWCFTYGISNELIYILSVYFLMKLLKGEVMRLSFRFAMLVLFVLGFPLLASGTDEVSYSLRDIPGVYVKDQTGHVHQVDMRGFDAPNVLVLINGRRTNATDLSSVDWGQITNDQVENIHVIKGPASVFYGDNSTGGAINIVTKKGHTEKPKIEFNSFTGSYKYFTESLGISQQKEDLDYSLNYRYKDEGGYRDNSEALVQNYGLNTGKKFEWGSLRLEASNYDAEFGLPGALSTQDIDIYGRRHSNYPDDNVKVDDYVVRNIIEFNGFELSGSFRNRDVGYDTNGFSSSSMSEFVQTELERRFDIGEHILTTGLLYQHNPTDIETTFQPRTKINKDDVGFFFQDTLFHNNWELSGGYRHDRAYYDFGEETRHEINNILTGGFAYFFEHPKYNETKDTSKIYYSWGQGFRNPTTDEFFSYYTGLNTDVKPQSSQIHEVGYLFDTKDQRYEATAFYIPTKNEIYFDPLNFTNSNLPENRRIGFELSAERKFNTTRLFSYYTFMDTQIKGGGDIPQVPDHKFTLGLKQKIKKAELVIKENYVGQRNFINDFSDSNAKQKAYFTTDISLSVPYKLAELKVGVDNVFDREYSDIGVLQSGTEYFYPNPARTFYINFKLAWGG